jgi:hypothetical protein
MDFLQENPQIVKDFEKELRQNSYVHNLMPVTNAMVDAAIEGFEKSENRSAGVFMSRSVARDMLEAVTRYLASRL